MKLSEMLDTLVAREGSERRATAFFDIGQSSFNNWRRGRAFPSDDQARRLAELLKLDAAYVLAVIHGERAKSKETRAAWHRVAEAFKDAAMIAALCIGAASFGAPSPAQAGSGPTLHNTNSEYTL